MCGAGHRPRDGISCWRALELIRVQTRSALAHSTGFYFTGTQNRVQAPQLASPTSGWGQVDLQYGYAQLPSLAHSYSPGTHTEASGAMHVMHGLHWGRNSLPHM